MDNRALYKAIVVLHFTLDTFFADSDCTVMEDDFGIDPICALLILRLGSFWARCMVVMMFYWH